jgi:signal peptidase II
VDDSTPGSGVPEPARTRPLRMRVYVLAALVLVADQATKRWATTALAGEPPKPVIGDLIQFRLLYNPGAAFSIGVELTWLLTVVAAVVVVAVAVVGWRVRSPGWSLGLGLVLGGATTHLLDRLFREPSFGRGHVVDFIDYAGFFVGNVADIAIVLGSATLAVMGLLGVAVDGTGHHPQRARRS